MSNLYKSEIFKMLDCDSLSHICISLKKLHPEIYKDVVNKTSFLNDKCKLSWRFVYYLNDVLELPHCKECGKPCNRVMRKDNMVQFINDPKSIFYCSRTCHDIGECSRERAKQTIIDKYGPLGLKCESIREKSKQTTIQKYGVPNVSNLPEMRRRAENTMLSRYGAKFTTQVPELIQKVKQTVQERFGVDNVFKNEQIKEKIKETNLEKYGFDRPTKNTSIQNKVMKTVLEKFNVPYVALLPGVTEKSTSKVRTLAYERYTDSAKRECYMLDTLEEFLNNSENKQHQYLWKCQKCGNVFRAKIDGNKENKVRCFKCYPLITMRGRSRMEQEIADFVKDVVGLDVEVIQGTRKVIDNQEIDIYVPKFNLAIEFDGLYWHSQQKLKEKCDNPSKFHWQKTEDCEAKGIHLIHIFEDEWMFKKDIVKSRLRGLLNSYDKRIYARKCKIELIDPKTSREFVAQNHLQGSVNAGVNLALTYEDEIVSVMTFGNFRKSMGRTVEPNSYELLRFCSKLNYRVIGGAGKLFKRFIDQYKPYKVITYADRRWSLGNLYQKLGFQNMKKTSPNYWYVVNGHREYRFKYRKNDLHNLLEHFDPNKTEYENMLANGIDRVFDCGNYSFDLVYPENKVEEKKETEDSELLF